MHATKICNSFRFDQKGVTKAATFTGPVVVFDDGFLLVPKSMQTQSGAQMTAMFGLLGYLIASLSSNVKKAELPYPTITYGELEQIFPGLPGLGKLKIDQRVIVLKREQVLGYTASFWTGVQLVCSGENVALTGARKKIVAALAEFGYQEQTKS